MKNGFALNKELASKAGKKSKRTPLNKAWRDQLERVNKNKETLIDEVFDILISEARNKNINAIKELLLRAYGKPESIIEFNDVTPRSSPLADEIGKLRRSRASEK